MSFHVRHVGLDVVAELGALEVQRENERLIDSKRVAREHGRAVRVRVAEDRGVPQVALAVDAGGIAEGRRVFGRGSGSGLG